MSKIADITSFQINFPHSGTQILNAFLKTNRERVNSSAKVSLIYGHNGSGKTTISDSFKKISQESESEIVFFDKEGETLDISAEFNTFFVFNESFVEENIKVEESTGLNPIVLIGDNAKLQYEIDSKEADLATNNQQETKKEELVNSVKKSMKQAHSSYCSSMRNAWRQRSAMYTKNSQMSNFMSSIQSEITSLDLCDNDLNKLRGDFEDTISKLKHADNTGHVDWTNSFNPPSIRIIDKIKNYLSSSIEPPEDTSSFAKFSEFTKNELKQKINGIFSPESNICNQCLQNISEEFKQNIINEILEYLELANLQAKNLQTDIPRIHHISFPDIPDDIQMLNNEIKNYELLKVELERHVKNINEKINIKSENPHIKIDIDVNSVLRCIDSIQKFLTKVEGKIFLHNKYVDEVENLRNHAYKLNNQITSAETKKQREIFLTYKEESISIEEDLHNITIRSENLKKEISNLKSRFNNIDQAATHINKLLRIVLGNNGMSVEVDSDRYQIINRGTPISPNHLSTGEKNILALCYFFINISNNFRAEKYDNIFVVLDDPISSLDFDNRYGITTLLNHIFRKICINDTSKVLILSHDLSVIQDMQNIFKKIQSCTINYSSLKNGEMTLRNASNLDLYSEILDKMYECLIDQSVDPRDLLTHNEIRRVWEGFTTFYLGEKITDANSSVKIKKFLVENNPRLSGFLDSYSGHIFINLDSHSEQQMQNMNFDLTPSLGENELRRFVEETLCFMTSIAPYHIPAKIRKKDAEVIAVRNSLSDKLNQLISLYE